MSAYIYGGLYTMIYVVLCSFFVSIFSERRERKKVTYIAVMLLWGTLEYILSVFLAYHMVIKMLAITMINIVLLLVLYDDAVKKSIFLSIFYQLFCAISDYSSIVLLGKLVPEASINLTDEAHFGLLAGTFSQMMIVLLLFLMNSRNLE